MGHHDHLVGTTGTVITSTRGDQGLGEVSVVERGCREVYLARSKDPLPKGTSVLVIGTEGLRILTIEPWDEALSPLGKNNR